MLAHVSCVHVRICWLIIVLQLYSVKYRFACMFATLVRALRGCRVESEYICRCRHCQHGHWTGHSVLTHGVRHVWPAYTYVHMVHDRCKLSHGKGFVSIDAAYYSMWDKKVMPRNRKASRTERRRACMDLLLVGSDRYMTGDIRACCG